MKFPAYDNREFLEFDQGIENTRTGILYAGSGLLSVRPTRQIMFFPFSNFRNKEGHREPVFLEQRLRMELIGVSVVQGSTSTRSVIERWFLGCSNLSPSWSSVQTDVDGNPPPFWTYRTQPFSENTIAKGSWCRSTYRRAAASRLTSNRSDSSTILPRSGARFMWRLSITRGVRSSIAKILASRSCWRCRSAPRSVCMSSELQKKPPGSMGVCLSFKQCSSSWAIE